MKILKEINNRYSELKSMINNIEFDILLNKLERKIDNIYQIIQNLFKVKIEQNKLIKRIGDSYGFKFK